MEGLRWTLAIVTLLAAIAWLLFFSWGNSFRSSFGASRNSEGLLFLPLLVMGLLIGSLLLPKFSGAGAIGLTYCGLWLVYYGMAV